MRCLRQLKMIAIAAGLLAAAGTQGGPAADRQPDLKSSGAEKKAAETGGFKNIGVAEFEKLRADKKNVVLDVRTAKEFDAGHVPGAVHIDWNGPDFAKKVSALDKGKVYLVHCAAGGRSAKASAAMGKLNFKQVYNLEGGFRAWEEAGHKGQKK